MVEIGEMNPAGQIRIKPLCSNCDGKEAWVKPKDILAHMGLLAEIELENMPEDVRKAMERMKDEKMPIE